jgi:oxazoline/thiazoline dehydrogenase
MDRLTTHDHPTAWTMENRRSRRRKDGNAITVTQLGEFLYRTARIQRELFTGEYNASLRPYPGGGAIHALEVYLATERCEGLIDGLYHYCPARHVLEILPLTSEQSRELIDRAQFSMGKEGRPRVLFVITARFQRLAWKYEGLAYALALKDLGGLYQTFYLTATAMDLFPCALGTGDTDLFCRSAGLEFHVESPVGEFALS